MQENNRHTLRQALNQLPQYKPEDAIWREINQKLPPKLQEEGALKKLPQHQAPKHIWQKLSSELVYERKEKNREQLKESIEKLPNYSPPIHHWYQIEAYLDSKDAHKKKRRRSLVFSVAATFLVMGLLFTSFLWIKFQFREITPILLAEKALPDELRLEEGELVYSQETISQLLSWEYVPTSSREDTLDLQYMLSASPKLVELASFLKADILWLNDPELLKLKKELELLDEAILRLQEMLPYNEDPLWVKHLVKIEHQRVQIIQDILQRL